LSIVKTSVDKELKFRKIKSMQHVLVVLQYEKSSCYSILIFAVSLFGCPGTSPRFPPSAHHWVRWATFRKLESRMDKSGYVNHVRNRK